MLQRKRTMSNSDTTPENAMPESWQHELREWHRQVDEALEAFRREHGCDVLGEGTDFVSDTTPDEAEPTDEEFRRHWRESRQQHLGGSGKFGGPKGATMIHDTTMTHEQCEWAPLVNRPADSSDDPFACLHAATVCVGANGTYHLCAACADLSRFKRLKKSPLKEHRS